MPVYRYRVILNNEELTIDVLQGIHEEPFERLIDIPKEVIIEGDDVEGVHDETPVERIPTVHVVGPFEGQTPKFYGGK